VSADGGPVWPLASREDAEHLASVAELFNVPMKQVAGRAGRTEPGVEVVVSLGEDADHAGRLYAHLTRRRWRHARSIDALVSEGLPDVLVTTTRWMTITLMEALYPLGSARIPGIIVGDGIELHHQVLLRSASGVLRGPLRKSRIDILPTEPLGEILSAERDVLGRAADPSEVRRALAAGAGVLSLASHSDGVDAFLGDQTLCPMDELAVSPGTTAMPECQITRFCHRHKVPYDDAQTSDLLVRPRDIRARIFIFQVCSGLLLQGAIVDPAWSLAYRLLRNPCIGAVVTPWEYIFSEASEVHLIAADLLAGRSIGEAVGRFVDSDRGRALRQRLCVLGDPGLRLPAQAQRDVDDCVTGTTTRIVHRSYLRATTDVGFLRGLLDAWDMADRAAAFPSLSRARAAVRDYDDGQTHEAAGTRMREAVLEFLGSATLSPYMVWTRLSTPLQAVDDDRCYGCGSPCRTFEGRIGIGEGFRRRLLVCWRCGVVADLPLGFPRLSTEIVNDTVLQLAGDLPRSHWSACVRITTPVTAQRRGWMWPAREDGSMVCRFQLPESFGPAHDAKLFVLIEASMALFMVPR
jgi:hypothetical protein